MEQEYRGEYKWIVETWNCSIYQITIASVEPAGMIPNLNRSFGRKDSTLSSIVLSGKEEKQETH